MSERHLTEVIPKHEQSRQLLTCLHEPLVPEDDAYTAQEIIEDEYDKVIYSVLGRKNRLFRRWCKLPKLSDVPYYSDSRNLEKQGFKIARNGTGHAVCLISPFDDSVKTSKDYYRCTSLMVTGYDTKEKKWKSLVTHQDPAFFLNAPDPGFPRSSTDVVFGSLMSKALSEVREKADLQHISAKIIAGSRDRFLSKYGESVAFLKEHVQRELGIDAEVVTEPLSKELHVGSQHLIVDTPKNQAHFFRGRKV
jgi:hypothetical protein